MKSAELGASPNKILAVGFRLINLFYYLVLNKTSYAHLIGLLDFLWADLWTEVGIKESSQVIKVKTNKLESFQVAVKSATFHNFA